jgi:hypothetical protein
MSHDFSQDKAGKKLGMPEITLIKLFSGQNFFKRWKANFHQAHLPHNQYLEKTSRVGD